MPDHWKTDSEAPIHNRHPSSRGVCIPLARFRYAIRCRYQKRPSSRKYPWFDGDALSELRAGTPQAHGAPDGNPVTEGCASTASLTSIPFGSRREDQIAIDRRARDGRQMHYEKDLAQHAKHRLNESLSVSRFPLPTLERIDTAAHICGDLQQPRRSRRCYGEGTACAAMARAPSTLVLVESAGSPRNILYRRLAPPCGKVRPREPLPCYPLGRTDTTPISGHCQTRSPINNNAHPPPPTSTPTNS